MGKTTIWMKVTLLFAGTLCFSLSAGGSSGRLVVTADTLLTEDHSGEIVIGADNITLDCGGHTVTPPGWTGILLEDRTGVTVRNCHVSGFTPGLGFVISSSSGNRLEQNTATGNSTGFQIGSSDNTLVGNEAVGNTQSGFELILATGNTLAKNTATENGWHGFFFVSSSDNVVKDNAATANLWDGFSLQGESQRNDLTRNLAEDNGSQGFRLTIVGYGDSYLKGNEAYGNGEDGFALLGATGNDLVKNVASQNEGYGINLHQATDNVLTKNEACLNRGGPNNIDDVINLTSDNVFVKNEFCYTVCVPVCGG